MAKDRSQPLPYHPNSHSPDHPHDEPMTAQLAPEKSSGSSLSRKFSTKRLWLGSNTKNNSPTYIPQSIAEGRATTDANLDPSAAATLASNHLTAGMNGSQPSTSPNQINVPSPTSPINYQNQQHLNQRAYREQSQATARSNYSHPEEGYSSNASTLTNDRDRSNPTPTPGNINTSRNPRVPTSREPYQPPSSTQQSSQQDDTNAPASSRDREPVEIFKSFRVSMEDPCEKVLPAALKKYNINADWKNYALYIVYGDQERCLGLREKPLILFKQLDKEGRKPMFMLRRHAAPLEGHSGPTSGAGAAGVEGGYGGGFAMGGRGPNQSSIQLPGGVL